MVHSNAFSPDHAGLWSSQGDSAHSLIPNISSDHWVHFIFNRLLPDRVGIKGTVGEGDCCLDPGRNFLKSSSLWYTDGFQRQDANYCPSERRCELFVSLCIFCCFRNQRYLRGSSEISAMTHPTNSSYETTF